MVTLAVVAIFLSSATTALYRIGSLLCSCSPQFFNVPDDEDEDSRVDVAMMWATWDAFLAAGGVTADDLRRFLNGEQISNQPVKRLRVSPSALRRSVFKLASG
jgi:hypothetical protein